MKVSEIMTKDIIFVRIDTKINEVSQLLTKHGIHGVPVLSDSGLIQGIITESDFFIKDIPNLYLPSYLDFLKKASLMKEMDNTEKEKMEILLKATAKDIMTTNCFTISDETDVRELLNIFKTRHFYTMPVVNSSKTLVGIITLADIVKMFK